MAKDTRLAMRYASLYLVLRLISCKFGPLPPEPDFLADLVVSFCGLQQPYIQLVSDRSIQAYQGQIRDFWLENESNLGDASIHVQACGRIDREDFGKKGPAPPNMLYQLLCYVTQAQACCGVPMQQPKD